MNALLDAIAWKGGVPFAAVCLGLLVVISVQRDRAHGGRGRWVTYVDEGDRMATLEEHDENFNEVFRLLCDPCNGDQDGVGCICNVPCASEHCKAVAASA